MAIMSILHLPNRQSGIFSERCRSSRGASAGDGVLHLQIAGVASTVEEPKLSSLLSWIAASLHQSATIPSIAYIAEACRRIVAKRPDVARDIHDKADMEFAKYAQRTTAALLENNHAEGIDWLSQLLQIERQWSRNTDLLAAMLLSADTVPIRKQLGTQPIPTKAHIAFQTLVLQQNRVSGLTESALLSTMDALRRSNRLETPIVKQATAMLANYSCLQQYEAALEEQTSQYHRDSFSSVTSKAIAEPASVFMYIRSASKAVQDEAHVARQTLPTFLWSVLESAVEQAIKETRFAEISAIAANQIVATKELDNFTATAGLYMKLGEFPRLSADIASALQASLQRVISDPSLDHLMIETVLSVRRFLDLASDYFFTTCLLSDSRNQQRVFQEQMRAAFSNAIGSRQNAPAECIAKYLDTAMRHGQGSRTEREFGQLLDEIVALVSYTKDKDIFKAFYSSALAKRLLLNKSASDDLERSMIIKLQREMGDEFTSGDTMLKDLQLSESLAINRLNKAFQQAKVKDPDSLQDPSHVSVNVLTESAWPSYPQLAKGWNLLLAPKLQQSLDVFTLWYGTQHKNRKLLWRHQLASVTLSATFPAGKYELNVSLFQALVLLQFNDEDTLSFEEIASRTGIEPSELARTLQSLALGKKTTRVLLKRPMGKEVVNGDRFTFNVKFVSDRIRFRINQLQQDLSAEESKQTNQQVLVDRTAILDAYVVKIMKGRKRLSLQALIEAVIEAVHKLFPPDVKDIKKRVEDLIEREYLERDAEDKNVLNYLA